MISDAMNRDTAAEIVNWLRPILQARSEPYTTGVQLGNQQPEPNTLDPAGLPLLVIQASSAGGEWPHTQQDDVRFTAWHRDRDQALDLARLTHAIVRNTEGGPLEQIDEITAPTATRDLSSGTDLAGFTIVTALTPGTFTE